VTEFQILLDAPKPGKPIEIARIGTFEDPRYGTFTIDPSTVADWAENARRFLPGGEVLVDRDHASEKRPRNSEAMGWLSNIRVSGDRVLADARWTKAGRRAVKDGSYRFTSVAYGDMDLEDGRTVKNVLQSCALTNRPALRGLAPITLSAAARKFVDKAAKKERRKARELDAPQPARQRTLEQQASDRGLVLLDRSELARLQSAAVDRDNDRFDHAFADAVRGHRVTPGEEQHLRRFFQLDQVAALESMALRQRIMPEGPIGEPAIDWTTDPDILEDRSDDYRAAGFEPASVLLDQRIRRRMRDNRNLDYAAAAAEEIGSQS
jgi:phage I-like protein